MRYRQDVKRWDDDDASIAHLLGTREVGCKRAQGPAQLHRGGEISVPVCGYMTRCPLPDLRLRREKTGHFTVVKAQEDTREGRDFDPLAGEVAMPLFEGGEQ